MKIPKNTIMTQAGALKYKTFIERSKSKNNNKKTHTEGTLTSGKIKRKEVE